MNVTLILQRSIGAAFRKMCRGFTAQPNRCGSLERNESYCRAAAGNTTKSVAWRSEVKRCQPQKAKPLRVLRYVEGGLPRASVGRMVMSGSMADVCAELDRLVAQEMTLH
jgi:hypothetical protein